jgi:hypothetical protein
MRVEVAHEPFGGEVRNSFEGAGPNDQMRRPLHDLQVRLAGQPSRRRPMELQHHHVIPADDQQRGLAHRFEVPAGQVGTTAARNDRRYSRWPLGGSDECRGAPVLAPNKPTCRPAVGR